MGDMPYETGEPYVTKKNRNKATAASSRVYTQEELDGILEQRDEQRGRQREDSQRRSNEDEGEGTVVGIDPKLLKQLQATVSVFNTLKEFSSSPLQKAIETEVGTMAVGAIKNSFGQPSSGGKKDLLDLILNSQLAFGFGQGLGAKSPELVEALGRTVGKEKTDRFVDNMLDQYGKGSGQGRGRGQGQGPSPGQGQGRPSPAGTTGPGSSKDENINKLLSLDINNPEHIAAYAESQGNIRPNTARKMLMMHQDEIIEQMRLKGLDVSGFEQTRQKGNEYNGRNVQEEETARLKREQQEMLIMKRQLDQQLQQLPPEDREEAQENQEKVVSYKDIHKKTEVIKPKIVEEVVKIPDKWGENDLNEVESKSIRKAELARQANARNNSVKEANGLSGVKETNESNGINDVKETGEKDIVGEAPVLVPVPEEDVVPIIVPVPEEDVVPIIVPVPIDEVKQSGEHDKQKYKFKVVYGVLTKILLDGNGKETYVRSAANEEETIAYEKKHGVKIH